ncbi:sugar-binding protein [Flexithrix dorotheae]|uniref:sugar-binding protein n=1 Tax=Flexithrix dorotheae TaxID=70993 RepID=UPI00037F73A8|nr:sugar-binding protein [Flexithrix dorotheae]
MKYFILTITGIFFLSCKSPSAQQFVALFQEEIRIDGKLDDWKLDHPITIHDREIAQGDHKRVLSDNQVKVYANYNQQYLFLAFQVNDADLRAIQTEREHPKLFLDDMVEFLIDADNDKSNFWNADDFVCHINLNGTIKDDRGDKNGNKNVDWDGQYQFEITLNGTLNNSSDVDKGYILEVAVPWEVIEKRPEKGMTMGFNFANGDNDGKGRQLFDWMGAWPARSPNQFGTLILE